jgi:hypothetical protein
MVHKVISKTFFTSLIFILTSIYKSVVGKDGSTSTDNVATSGNFVNLFISFLLLFLLTFPILCWLQKKHWGEMKISKSKTTIM